MTTQKVLRLYSERMTKGKKKGISQKVERIIKDNTDD